MFRAKKFNTWRCTRPRPTETPTRTNYSNKSALRLRFTGGTWSTEMAAYASVSFITFFQSSFSRIGGRASNTFTKFEIKLLPHYIVVWNSGKWMFFWHQCARCRGFEGARTCMSAVNSMCRFEFGLLSSWATLRVVFWILSDSPLDATLWLFINSLYFGQETISNN